MMLKTLIEVLTLAVADNGDKDVSIAFVKGRTADFETNDLWVHEIGRIIPVVKGEHADVVRLLITGQGVE